MTMITLGIMSWANHVARMGKRELYSGCPWGNVEERGHLEVLGVDG